VSTATNRRCSATNQRDKPARLARHHQGRQVRRSFGHRRYAAIGMAGGRVSVRSRLGLDPELADGRLRKKAKAALEVLLDSEDEGRRLSAARALYSYAPAKPVGEERLVELLRNATETGRLVEDQALREAVKAAAEKLATTAVEGDHFRWDLLRRNEQAELERLLEKGRSNGR
jgi:hypothetical protein